MTHGTKFERNLKKCATHGTKNTMESLRDTVRSYMDKHDMTADEFAQHAGVSTHTMHSILYKHSDDCKLSTAISIAHAIGIGVDELANTGALPDVSLESVQIVRSLPHPTIELVRRYIRWQKHMYEHYRNHPGKLVDVMNLDYTNDHLRTTEDIEKIDISEMSNDIKAKVFRGVRIPCNEYIQFYGEGDILLLADDRPPKGRERCVIMYYNRVFIVQKERKDGIVGYRGIRSSMLFVPESEIQYYFGYVAGVKRE